MTVTEVPVAEPRRVTNGELRTYKQCKRKWWLGWYRHLRPRAPEVVGAAPLGTLVHLALAAYYNPEPRNPFTVLDEKVAQDRARLTDDFDAIQELEKQADMARTMLEGYCEWLAETGIDQGLSIVAAETKIDVPFPAYPGVNLLGKLDLRIQRDIDGARLFLDHKTVGDLTSPVKMLHMDEQMLHYHLLEYLDYLRALGPEGQAAAPRTDGGLYNMLRKVKRTARANPPFYDRVEVRHNVHELRAYYTRVFGEVVDMMETARKLEAGEDHHVVAYPNPTRDCTWKCEFFGVCPILDENPTAGESFLADWFEVGNPLDRYDEAPEL